MQEQAFFPSLSETGWVTGPTQIADYLFSHFLESDYSQSFVYKDNVSSFAWVMATEQGNTSRIESLMQRTLTTYFGRYFSNVVVRVSHEEDPADPARLILTIAVDFTDKDGVQYNLGRLLNTINGKITNVIAINNDGL